MPAAVQLSRLSIKRAGRPPAHECDTKVVSTSEVKTRTEEINLSGNRLLREVHDIVQQGNIRCITIKNDAGVSLI